MLEAESAKHLGVPRLVGGFVHVVVAVYTKIIPVVEVGVNVVILLSEGMDFSVSKVIRMHQLRHYKKKNISVVYR